MVCALALIASAYLAHAVKAGIAAIGPGQWQAGLSLGLTRWQTLRMIVPQALRMMVPSFINQWISLIKDTSLAYIVGVGELTFLATQVNNRSMVYPMEVFLFVALVYFVFCLALDLLANAVNRRFGAQTRALKRSGAGGATNRRCRPVNRPSAASRVRATARAAGPVVKRRHQRVVDRRIMRVGAEVKDRNAGVDTGPGAGGRVIYQDAARHRHLHPFGGVKHNSRIRLPALNVIAAEQPVIKIRQHAGQAERVPHLADRPVGDGADWHRHLRQQLAGAGNLLQFAVEQPRHLLPIQRLQRLFAG